MRLLFVGTSPAGRGTETHLVTLAAAMAGKGHAVEAVACAGGYVRRALEQRGLRVEPGVFRNAMDPRGFRAVFRAGRRFRPDWLVGSFGHEYWPLVALARALGVRLALFRHLPTRLRPLSRTFLPRLADRFLAVSAWLKGELVRSGVREDRVSVLYNPLELERFRVDAARRAQARAALGYREGEVVVGFVGALSQGKGAFTLAAALNGAMSEDASLRGLWVGQVEAHPRLREAISPEHRSRHRLEGWTDEVGPLYAAMDLLAVPSERPDVFPRVSLEAQASGVPVLASDAWGIPETLVNGRTGRLVTPGDVGAWREALLALSRAGPQARSGMGRAGAEHVGARFGAEAIAAELEALLR